MKKEISADVAEVNVGSNIINAPSNNNNKMETNPVSKAPVGSFDQPNPLLGMKIIKIPKYKLKKFELLPDYFSDYHALHPIAVNIEDDDDDEFSVIAGYSKVEAVDDPNQEIDCFYFNFADNSRLSLVIEKFAVMDRPFGGEASYAEKVWQSDNIETFISKDQTLKIVSGRGGVRKGKDYESCVSLTTVLAKRLQKDRYVVKNYLTHGNHIPSDVLEKLAEAKVGKDYFEILQPKKTKLIESLKGKTQQEKETAVRNLVWEVLAQHQADKEKKEADKKQAKAEGKTAKGKGNAKAKAKVTTATPIPDDAKNGNEVPANPDADIETKLPSEINDEAEVMDLLEGGELNLNSAQELSDSSAVGGNAVNEKTIGTYGSFVNLPTIPDATFAEIGKLGETLKSISEKRSPIRVLLAELNTVMGNISRIITELAEVEEIKSNTFSEAA